MLTLLFLRMFDYWKNWVIKASLPHRSNLHHIYDILEMGPFVFQILSKWSKFFIVEVRSIYKLVKWALNGRNMVKINDCIKLWLVHKKFGHYGKFWRGFRRLQPKSTTLLNWAWPWCNMCKEAGNKKHRVIIILATPFLLK